MKPGPLISMLVLLFLGAWLVFQPYLARQRHRTPGAASFRIVMGAEKVDVEMRPSPDDSSRYQYRLLDRPETADAWIDEAAFQKRLLDESAPRSGAVLDAVQGLFNVTSWQNLLWVGIGLGGQACFFGRMLIQWVVSERKRQSVVPAAFWWLSLFGGVALFTYFVWRVDFVGVLGQSTGIVIYARNLRLIKKHNRRLARQAAAAEAEAEESQLK